MFGVKPQCCSRARGGVTYTEEGVHLCDRTVAIEIVSEPFRVVAGKELGHVACRKRSKTLILVVSVDGDAAHAPEKMDPDGGPGMLSTGNRMT